jgi:hypothetical protein
MANITYIYILENIHNNPNLVYVGKTKNPHNRKQNHIAKYGPNIIYTIIDQINTLDRDVWKPIESYWMEQFKQWGFELENKNEGGSGVSFHTEETKDKLVKKLIGRKITWIDKLKKPKPVGFEKTLSKPIYQIDINTGIMIKEFSSIEAASNDLKINRRNIGNCLNGLYQSAGSFGWKYKNINK